MLNRNVSREVIFGLSFAATFAGLSFLFSLLSFGRVPGELTGIPPATAGLMLHMTMHALVGLVVALPSRRIGVILGLMCAAVLIDVDHIGEMMRLPMLGRPSHSIGFIVIVGLLMALLTRLGLFDRSFQSRQLFAMVAAGVLAHLAVDFSLPGAEVPLWMPLSVRPVQFNAVAGVAAAVLGATIILVGFRRNRPSAQLQD